MDNIIEIKDLNRIFTLADGNKLHVLQDVNIGIPRAALTLLKGPSGSGKTTLMNAIGALDTPETGSIIFKDKDITKMSEEERGDLRRKNFGFIFQSVSLIPIMTVYENVEFALRLANYQGNKRERVEKCLHMVGLSSRIDHMPQELSGGEQQRVAIARAIAHEPAVLFADEPTAELDSQTAINVVNIFKGLVKEEGVTIVMTTHDTSLMSAGDVAYTIEQGHIV